MHLNLGLETGNGFHSKCDTAATPSFIADKNYVVLVKVQVYFYDRYMSYDLCPVVPILDLVQSRNFFYYIT